MMWNVRVRLLSAAACIVCVLGGNAHAQETTALVFANYEIDRLSFYTDMFRARSSKALLYGEFFSEGTPEEVEAGEATDTGWFSYGVPVQLYFEDADLLIRAHYSEQQGRVQRTRGSPVVESTLRFYGGGITIGEWIYANLSYVDVDERPAHNESGAKSGFVAQAGIPILNLYHTMGVAEDGGVGSTRDMFRLTSQQIRKTVWSWVSKKIGGPLRPLLDFTLAVDSVRRDVYEAAEDGRLFFLEVNDSSLLNILLSKESTFEQYYVGFPVAGHVGLNGITGNYARAGALFGAKMEAGTFRFDLTVLRAEYSRVFDLGDGSESVDGYRLSGGATFFSEKENPDAETGIRGVHASLALAREHNFSDTLWRLAYLKDRSVWNTKLELGYAW